MDKCAIKFQLRTHLNITHVVVKHGTVAPAVAVVHIHGKRPELTATLPREDEPIYYNLHYHHHQSLNREGRWGTIDDFATSFLHFSLVLHCPLGRAELQACPFLDVVFPPLPVSALSSSPNLTQGKRAQFTATLSGENEPN